MIRNLPQLQKLDNVIVQPDEVADAMRRGIELIHPYDQDESIPYTNYAPPGGPPSYQPQVSFEIKHFLHVLACFCTFFKAPTSRRGSVQVENNHAPFNFDERRSSQFEPQVFWLQLFLFAPFLIKTQFHN